MLLLVLLATVTPGTNVFAATASLPVAVAARGHSPALSDLRGHACAKLKWRHRLVNGTKYKAKGQQNTTGRVATTQAAAGGTVNIVVLRSDGIVSSIISGPFTGPNLTLGKVGSAGPVVLPLHYLPSTDTTEMAVVVVDNTMTLLNAGSMKRHWSVDMSNGGDGGWTAAFRSAVVLCKEQYIAVSVVNSTAAFVVVALNLDANGTSAWRHPRPGQGSGAACGARARVGKPSAACGLRPLAFG